MDSVTVELSAGSPEHTAGKPLGGTVHLPARWQQPGLSITATLRWWTEGKGEAERGELQFPIPVPTGLVPAAIPFELRLPAEPWSYEGRLIKIRWTLNVSLHLRRQTAATDLPLVIRSPFARTKQGPYRT